MGTKHMIYHAIGMIDSTSVKNCISVKDINAKLFLQQHLLHVEENLCTNIFNEILVSGEGLTIFM